MSLVRQGIFSEARRQAFWPPLVSRFAHVKQYMTPLWLVHAHWRCQAAVICGVFAAKVAQPVVSLTTPAPSQRARASSLGITSLRDCLSAISGCQAVPRWRTAAWQQLMQHRAGCR